MLSWSLSKIACWVYVACGLLVAAMAATGFLGAADLATGTGWVLVGWLAGYATIAIMLVIGTLQFCLRDVLMKLVRGEE